MSCDSGTERACGDTASEDAIRAIPIVQLNFGDVRLRRKIIRAGFDKLPDLFACSESEIDDKFDWDDADAIIKLKGRYEEDPKAFLQSVLTSPSSSESEKKKASELVKPRESVSRKRSYPSRRSLSVSVVSDAPLSLPNAEFSSMLLDCNVRAKATLDSLTDRYDDVLVYQAFDEFATELEEISEGFQSLFEHYGKQPRSALGLAERLLPDAFLIFVADRARNDYDGENLWGNFFYRIGIDNANLQGDFKRVFVRLLERRHMPLYARDEEANYYFYTALLHGGLSSDAWENLWSKSIIPLVKEVSRGHLALSGDFDGHMVLREIKNPESGFAPKKSVLNILDKAPDSTIAPLFEASVRVAAQLESASRFAEDYTMLTSYGLPDVAMQALPIRKQKARNKSTFQRVRKASGQTERLSQIVYLPEARLQLDLATGLVSLHWNRQQFPSNFIKNRIDYYVDGSLEKSECFKASVGKCILDAVDITVAPQARYDVELKLMERTDEGGWAEVSSLGQSFTRSKPGCFEFMRDIEGIYRLRGKRDKITRTRRVAYIVKPGYDVVPGQGMTAINTSDADRFWDGAQILVFDVEPGAYGSIVDLSSHEEVAVWQERYAAKIDKRRIIGETREGLDLYGYVPSALGTNEGLPSVAIEALDGLAAVDDLDIVCICDGKRVSVPRRVLWHDNSANSVAAQVELALSASSQFDWHIECCELEARQRSAGGQLVFRYRFAVVPIREFKLISADYDCGIFVANYQFQAQQDLRVVNSQGDEANVLAWARYEARTLLADEFLSLRIESVDSGKATNARLALAALDIALSKRLVEISDKRSICLADALGLGPFEGNVSVSAGGWRYNRGAMALMGEYPVFFKELKRPCKHEFNLFTHIYEFIQQDDCDPEDKSLKLAIIYGDDLSRGYRDYAWTDVELLRCRQGYGFTKPKMVLKFDGSREIVFDEPPLCDIRLDFKRRVGKALGVIDSVDVAAGETRVSIPESVAYKMDTRKKVSVTVAPMDWLGEPKYEYSTDFILDR